MKSSSGLRTKRDSGRNNRRTATSDTFLNGYEPMNTMNTMKTMNRKNTSNPFDAFVASKPRISLTSPMFGLNEGGKERPRRGKARLNDGDVCETPIPQWMKAHPQTGTNKTNKTNKRNKKQDETSSKLKEKFLSFGSKTKVNHSRRLQYTPMTRAALATPATPAGSEMKFARAHAPPTVGINTLLHASHAKNNDNNNNNNSSNSSNSGNNGRRGEGNISLTPNTTSAGEGETGFVSPHASTKNKENEGNLLDTPTTPVTPSHLDLSVLNVNTPKTPETGNKDNNGEKQKTPKRRILFDATGHKKLCLSKKAKKKQQELIKKNNNNNNSNRSNNNSSSSSSSSSSSNSSSTSDAIDYDWKSNEMEEESDGSDGSDGSDLETSDGVRSDEHKSWKDVGYGSKSSKSSKASKASKARKDEAMDEIVKEIKMSRKLLLPTRWGLLLMKFESMETALTSYLGRKQMFVTFAKLKHSIETICKKTFSMNDLRKILYIAPFYYHVEWRYLTQNVSKERVLNLTISLKDFNYKECIQNSRNSRNSRKNSLYKEKSDDKCEEEVRYLSTDKRIEREQYFRYQLVKYCVDEHDKYLKQNILIEFNAIYKGKWHRSFEIDNKEHIRPIPLAKLPPKHVQTEGQVESNSLELQGKMTITEAIRRDEEKKKRLMSQEMKKAMARLEYRKQQEELQKGNKAKSVNDLETPAAPSKLKFGPNGPSPSPELAANLKHLDPQILAKIKARKKVAKKMNEAKGLNKNANKSLGKDDNSSSKRKEMEKKFEEKRQWEEMPYLIGLIRSVCLAHKKSNMPERVLIEKIRLQHKRQKFINAHDIGKQLDLLASLTTKFLCVKNGRTMKIAKIDLGCDVKHLNDEIREKINGLL